MTSQKKRYQTALQDHLGNYARHRLGVFEKGTYKGRLYSCDDLESGMSIDFVDCREALGHNRPVTWIVIIG